MTAPAAPFHRKVRVAECDELIDAGIVELLQALWVKGLRTEQSCEDWGTLTRYHSTRWGPQMDETPVGWAYIKFSTVVECVRFCATLTQFRVWGLPAGEGDPMYVSFPATDIASLTEIWRR